MSHSTCPHARIRPVAFALLAAGLLALAIFSCSADDPNALGSDSDLLGSEPGDVYQDTLGVVADTVYAMNTPIATAVELELGMDSLYTRAMILQPSFSGLTDAMKASPVTNVELRIPPVKVDTSFPVRFYGYNKKYAQGDAVDVSDLPDSLLLIDPGTQSVDRNIEFSDALHALDPAVVKEWIDDEKTREAVVVKYTDTVNERLAQFIAVEKKVKKEDPEASTLLVTFGAPVNEEKSFRVVADATVYSPRYTTTNLIVSDGYPRRVYFRINRDTLADNAAVHTARVRFHIVPNTLRGSNSTLLLYIPDDPDPATAEFKTGQRIIERTITRSSETVEFPLTNALFLILQGKLDDTGFAIRFKDENTLLRQVELYGTDAPDSLKPRVFVTISTPAVFH